ncbi:winged helix-turn-helix domain-containing protein [Deinococcus aerophilus]|uniref:OmpR/PhoB-type domain-containing protein n=1 Tax=Deinococcus aerophilus TaxID=522488 RepID=A0ABQ2GML8_9DEIO|nr:winged helix-turn-helix domain-containing protein [Deinococcus aerophilus]GGM02016.1 hypothetical protein GCM10010841_08040 [Deinococcus aerophilus]
MSLLASLAATPSGSDVGLSAKEQALFDVLNGHPGRLFSRSAILERVWGLTFEGDDRIVDVYVRRIRRKLGEDTIETVRGAGYRCPEDRHGPQAWPHAHHLSPDARTVLQLGRRMLGAQSVEEVLLEIDAALKGTVQVAGVALLMSASRDREGGWDIQNTVGDPELKWAAMPQPTTDLAEYGEGWGQDRSTALLPLCGSGEIWGWLAMISPVRVRWPATARAQLEAVAALVHPALRLCQETALREQTQRELRELNARLEQRVFQRTQELRQAQHHSEALNQLSRRMETARSVPELLALSLPLLAQLAGTDACAAHWQPLGTPASPAPALACYRQDGTFCHVPGLPDPDAGTHDGAAQTGEGLTLYPDNGWTVRSEVDGDVLILHAFQVDGPVQTPDGSAAERSPQHRAMPSRAHAALPSPLLQIAAQSLALMLARQMQLAALERTALTDESTGLGNRQAFLADLHREVAFATRHGSGFALHLIEIANIRFMNATAGYAGGNDAILALVQTLNGVRRTEDRAYRLNGATFAVLLRSAPGSAAPPDGPPDDRQDRLKRGWPGRLRSALEGLLGRTPALNLHVGQALFPTGADSASELLRTALEDLGPLTVPAPTRRRSDAVPQD